MVDLALNEQISLVANLMRVGERAAFVYCPDDIAPRVARDIAAAVNADSTD